MTGVLLIAAGLFVYGGCSFVAGVLVYRKRAKKFDKIMGMPQYTKDLVNSMLRNHNLPTIF